MRDRCYLIAELGCNHCGDVETALRMVDAAAAAGVDAVKLQLRDVENPPAEWSRPYTGPHSYGETYLEHRRALELTVDEYRMVSDCAGGHRLDIGASVWDVRSATETARLISDNSYTPLDWLKVPSALITDGAVLRAVRDAGCPGPPIISTGMSTADEIEAAVQVMLAGPVPPVVLHCTSAYPCENSDVNLARMVTLAARYRSAVVGVSGHWRGIQIDAAAVAMGARVLERHMTLDRTMKGTDHAASLEPAGLAKWVRDVRAVEDAIGSGEIWVLPCEESARAKLRPR